MCEAPFVGCSSCRPSDVTQMKGTRPKLRMNRAVSPFFLSLIIRNLAHALEASIRTSSAHEASRTQLHSYQSGEGKRKASSANQRTQPHSCIAHPHRAAPTGGLIKTRTQLHEGWLGASKKVSHDTFGLSHLLASLIHHLSSQSTQSSSSSCSAASVSKLIHVAGGCIDVLTRTTRRLGVLRASSV